MRALYEGLERWIWSKWIDSGFYIERTVPNEGDLSPLGLLFAEAFDEVFYFTRTFNIEHLGHHKVHIGITVGLKDGGAFAGSKVSSCNENPWLHALSESWRHLQRFCQFKNKSTVNLVDRRLKYFGLNASDAKRQIMRAHLMEWPHPQILLDSRIPIPFDNLYLHRVIFRDYISWHFGDEERFVY
jgi:hypothetical protein